MRLGEGSKQSKTLSNAIEEFADSGTAEKFASEKNYNE